MKGSTIKGIGGAIIMIGLIGGLALGGIYTVPVAETAVSKFSSPSVTMQFNAALMALTWAVSVIMGLAFVVAGQIAENLETVVVCLSHMTHSEDDVNEKDDSEVQALVDEMVEG